MGRNHKILVGLASLTLFDIAVANAAPPPPPVFSWTGFYIGANVGQRWAGATFTGAPYNMDFGNGPISFPGRSENYGLGSATGGLHAGYNYLLSPFWLIGFEGDVSSGSGKSTRSAEMTVFDSNSDSYVFRRSSNVNLTWQATLRGRVGFVSGQWLFYGTGGVAFIHAKWNDSSYLSGIDVSLPVDPTVASFSGDKTLTGGVFGFGLEYMLDPRWIGRVEFLYENFGSFDVPHGFGPQTGTLDIGNVKILRFGISYKLSP
jgi:opacity protein-like surface antigen